MDSLLASELLKKASVFPVQLFMGFTEAVSGPRWLSVEGGLCVPDVLLSLVLIDNKAFNPCYTVAASQRSWYHSVVCSAQLFPRTWPEMH